MTRINLSSRSIYAKNQQSTKPMPDIGKAKPKAKKTPEMADKVEPIRSFSPYYLHQSANQNFMKHLINSYLTI